MVQSGRGMFGNFSNVRYYVISQIRLVYILFN